MSRRPVPPRTQRVASHARGVAPRPWLVGLLVALLCAIWGSTWIVIQGGLRDLPPFTSAGVRFLIAALVVSLLTPALRAREGGDTPRWWLCVIVGTVNFALSYGIVYWAETRLPSSMVAVLWSLHPMFMAISGHLFLPGERLRAPSWIGFALGLLGVGVLFATDLREFGAEGIPTALVVCVSPFVVALVTVAVKRWGSDASSVVLNRNSMWIGAALLLAVAFTVEQPSEAHWTAAATGSVIYLALMGTVVTFLLYYWLLRHAPAHKLSLIAYVIPAVALVLGWALGDEPVTRYTLGGTALILSGVTFVARQRPPPAPEAGSPEG